MLVGKTLEALRMLSGSFKRLFNILLSIQRSLRNLACHLQKGFFFMVPLDVDIERERRRKDNPDSMDEDVEDEVAELKAAHFEESIKYARRSVSDADIRKYQAFAQTLQQSWGFGTEFRFAEAGTGGVSGSDPFATSAGGADEDDLYS